MSEPDEVDHESDQLEPGDTLDDRGVVDVLDEGYSPPERSWIGDGWGTTAHEAATGEGWDARLARELPERDDDEGDGLGELYAGDAGQKLAEFLRGLVGSTAPFEFSPGEWPDIMAALIGAALGLQASYQALFLGVVGGGMILLGLFAIGAVGRKQAVPYAPFLALAAVVVVLTQGAAFAPL